MRRQRIEAQRRGRLAEHLATAWLMLKGYRILARNLDLGVGEIDLLARRDGLLVVVEVKRRASRAAGLEALGPRQRARLARAAEALRARRPDLAGLALRFDLVVIAPRRLPLHLVDAWRMEG
ncbi:MAG: YraN family protein [Alphaproteobacteria bacterium]|nr:YraN family protein [Alphaproteobacteria bacterium]